MAGALCAGRVDGSPPGTQVCEFCERSDLVGCPRCFYISKGRETLAYLWNRHEKNALQALNFMHRALSEAPVWTAAQQIQPPFPERDTPPCARWNVRLPTCMFGRTPE